LPKLSIPPQYREAISKIRSWDDRVFEELWNALDTSEVKALDQATVDAIARSVPDLPTVDVERTLESLAGLQLAHSLAGGPLEAFCDDVISEIERSDSRQSSTLSVEEQSRFADRLKKLMSFDSLSLAAKARDLLTDHERVYLNGKVITDVRPVFRGVPEELPAGFVLFHTLKLSFFRKDGVRANFYVALDDNDLSNLKKLLERAEVKSATLRKQLQDTGIKTLGEGRKR
jgi:hypothetical protein